VRLAGRCAKGRLCGAHLERAQDIIIIRIVLTGIILCVKSRVLPPMLLHVLQARWCCLRNVVHLLMRGAGRRLGEGVGVEQTLHASAADVAREGGGGGGAGKQGESDSSTGGGALHMNEIASTCRETQGWRDCGHVTHAAHPVAHSSSTWAKSHASRDTPRPLAHLSKNACASSPALTPMGGGVSI
jgi:hypothetical protein